MDKLHGVDSLPVVLHRFSDGVEVVKCVVEFCNEVAALERSYSESLHRLLRSSSYTFHSNLLFQWLEKDPYKEIGSLKHSWQELGQELCKLADLHSEQAEAYQKSVRKPLVELLPQLEEARRNMRVQVLQIKAGQEQAFKKMNRERQKYMGLGESCERLQSQIRSLKSTGITAKIRLSRIEKRLDSTERQLHEQEQIYHSAHDKYIQAHGECEENIEELYKEHHEREMKRVNALKEALLNFTKTLSNTAPAYLEGMQRIQISVDKIDAASDIQWFVNEHTSLQTASHPPPLEKHTFVRGGGGGENGRQSPIGGDGEREEEDEGEALNPEDGQDVGEEGTGAARGKWGGVRKWRVWGGIRGKRRPNEGRSEVGGEEGSDGEGTEDEEDAAERRERGKDSSGNGAKHLRGPHWRDGEEGADDSHAHTHTAFTHVSRAVRSVERSGDNGGREQRGAGTTSRGEQQTHRDAVKPTPNPKPTRLRGAGRGSESSSGSEGVKFSSLSSTLELDAEPGSPKQRENRPQRTTRPNPRTNQDQQLSTSPETKAATPQRRKRRVELKERDRSGSDSASTVRPRLPTLPVFTDTQQPLSAGQVKPPLPTKPVNLEKPVDADIHAKVRRLQEKAAENDYYRQFGVGPTATTEELARVRRELSRQLHPDHFAGQPEKQERAQQQLMQINQVFQDVLKSFETRTLYDQLCQFRQHYDRIPDQKQRGLQVAHSKLSSLHKQLKKNRAPFSLLSELTTAIDLLSTCQQLHQSTT